MIYKMRMGDPIEINLVPLGFSFKEISNQIKKFIGKNDVSSTLRARKCTQNGQILVKY